MLTNGYLWWSGLVEFEIDADGRQYHGSVLLDSTPSKFPHELQGKQPSPATAPKPEATPAAPRNYPEETLLFSQGVSGFKRVELAKTYYDWVAREYQSAYERYWELTRQMQRALLSHFELPVEWADGKETNFSNLPEWMKNRVVAELRSYFQ